MVKKFFVHFANGFVHELNAANEESANYISNALFPGLEIVSIS